MKTIIEAKLPSALVKIATAEIGVEEIDATNSGPRVNQFKAATNLPPAEPWPWCAAFVDWCVREAMAATATKETPSFKRPTTAGAYALEAWSRAQDESTWTLKPAGRDIQPGDILVFNFSHCGIAISAPDETGHFQTIEGNTDHAGSREGGGVFMRWRKTGHVRSRIRFRV
jgi:hypothetical protein